MRSLVLCLLALAFIGSCGVGIGLGVIKSQRQNIEQQLQRDGQSERETREMQRECELMWPNNEAMQRDCMREQRA